MQRGPHSVVARVSAPATIAHVDPSVYRRGGRCRPISSRAQISCGPYLAMLGGNELTFTVVDIVAGGHGSVFTEGRARKGHILERLGCGIFLWHALLLGFRGCASIACHGVPANDRAQLGACYSSTLMVDNNCGDKRRSDNNAGA